MYWICIRGMCIRYEYRIMCIECGRGKYVCIHIRGMYIRCEYGACICMG